MRTGASDRFVLRIEGAGLLGTMRRSCYAFETRSQSNWVNDLQVSANAMFHY